MQKCGFISLSNFLLISWGIWRINAKIQDPGIIIWKQNGNSLAETKRKNIERLSEFGSLSTRGQVDIT